MLVGVNGNLFTIFTHALELDNTFDQRKQGVVLAATDVIAGMDLCSTLAINNVTGFDNFSAEFFTTKSLAV